MMKKKKIQEEEEEVEKPNPESATADRISELPIEILHHILGFLEMDEFLIQTSLVSTKWRNLWKSVSTLTFTNEYDVEKDHSFLEHVLRLRDSDASKLRVFNYSWLPDLGDYDKLDKLPYLDKFILDAVNQGAQEIHILDVHSNQNFHINPYIFTSRLLRVFTFNVRDPCLRFGIQFPRSMCCATQLTHLTLYYIRLPEGDDDDDDSNAQLHLVCPVLVKLVMRNCCSNHLRVLDISAPKLYTLSICNSRMRYRGLADKLGECRIEIRTPNLTSLDYVGSVYDDCFTENLPRLANASLILDNETGMLEKETLFAIKLLKGLSSAERLALQGYEVLSGDTLKEILTPFTSLTTLTLSTNCRVSTIHGMIHILNICKSVESLFYGVDQCCSEEESDGEQLILHERCCRLSHLKYVSIKRLCGHKHEIEFVKFLLKNSIVLEEMIIHIEADSSSKRSIEEDLKQFIEKDELLFRRSLNVGQIFECSLGSARDLLERHYQMGPFDERYEPDELLVGEVSNYIYISIGRRNNASSLELA